MRMSDWSSDVCSSDLRVEEGAARRRVRIRGQGARRIGIGIALADIVVEAVADIGQRPMHLKAGRDVVLRVELHAALFQLSRVADHIANLDRIIDGCLQILEVIEESRSEERRVGKECVRTCRSRWAPYI